MSFEGAAMTSSRVPCHFSNSIAKPDEYIVFPHIPIIPPPRTAYSPSGPEEFLKSVNATVVKTKGAIMLGITHCGSAIQWSIAILKALYTTRKGCGILDGSFNPRQVASKRLQVSVPLS